MSILDLKKIGERLKMLRERLNLTQKDFAASVDISKTTLSDYERGKKNFGFVFLFRVSDKFNINLDYLLHGRGEPFIREGIGSDGYWQKKPYGDYSGDVREILDYMKRSRIALGAIVAYAKEYLFRNRELIEWNIKAAEGKNEDEDNE